MTYSIIDGADDVPLLVGEGGNPNGPALLFIHGMGQSHLAFLPQIQSDLGKDHRIILFDLRGHGGSAKPWEARDYAASRRVWAKDVAAVIKAKKLNDITLVAWSFGGYVAMDYIRYFGVKRVKALHFAGTLGGLVRSGFAQNNETSEIMASAARRTSLDLLANIDGYSDVPRGFTKYPIAEELHRITEISGHMQPSYVRRAMKALPLENQDLVSALPLPVLISIGTDDPATPLNQARELVSILPNAALSIYYDAKHFPSAEDTQRFNCELKSLSQTGEPKACKPTEAFKATPTIAEMRGRYASDGISNFITVEGVELHYRDKGDDKPVVIMLPGHMGNARMFDGWLPYLEEDFRTIGLDWPPYGLSVPDPNGEYSSKRGAELVIGFMEAMAIDTAALIGTSNGATVAAHVAALRPDLVKALALSTFPLGPPPKRKISPKLIEQAQLYFRNPTYRPPSLYRAILEDIFYDPAKVSDTFVRMYTDMNNHPGGYAAIDTYVASNRAMYKADNWPSIYEKVTAPTLLQWGDGGIVVPANLAQGSADAFTNATVTLARYPKSGHMPMLEEPEKTGKDVAAFLKQQLNE